MRLEHWLFDILMLHQYAFMMTRTTVRFDPHLLIRAKKLAAETGRTLTAVLEDALRESFSRRSEAKRERIARIPTFGGRGPRPGVNLDDSAALLELMESDRDSHRRQRTRLRVSRRRS